ncbi:MAG: hypothetical protein K1060chlam2_01159 [Chlamydiae bacterium]|nr:hypothetical protein [Chlamydiota bacterium]
MPSKTSTSATKSPSLNPQEIVFKILTIVLCLGCFTLSAEKIKILSFDGEGVREVASLEILQCGIMRMTGSKLTF